MSIGVFIQPNATWKPNPIPKPTPSPRRWPEPDITWADLAAEQRWEQAIIAYLKLNGKTLLWRVINCIAAETRPRTRSQTRLAARQALGVMMQLIRQRRIVRHRRRWVADLKLPVD
jgi:hypothetical protein